MLQVGPALSEREKSLMSSHSLFCLLFPCCLCLLKRRPTVTSNWIPLRNRGRYCPCRIESRVFFRNDIFYDDYVAPLLEPSSFSIFFSCGILVILIAFQTAKRQISSRSRLLPPARKYKYISHSFQEGTTNGFSRSFHQSIK